MSFSSDVKAEVGNVLPAEKHCRIAELSALLKYYAKAGKSAAGGIRVPFDNETACRKCFTLLSKTFNIEPDIFGKNADDSDNSALLTAENCDIKSIFSKCFPGDTEKLFRGDCCKRAYLRGIFLACGFVADPNTQYHLEFLVPDEETAKRVVRLFGDFGIEFKESVRKRSKVVYVKGSEAISDALNVLGAHRAMMDFVGARILKDVRNDINRRNNCDTANIMKAVNAASKQTEDILYIRQTVGLENLPATLREIATVRLEHPESSLTELGSFLDPPVGKSGVNHRLRKLSEYAEGLRLKG
jgi:DNA-binding protein WhiA